MTKTKPLSADHFARIHELQTQRQGLEREARRLASEERRLICETADALDQAGKTQAKRGDYRAEFTENPGRIGWKDECLKRLKDGELERLEEAVPVTRKLNIIALAAALLLCVSIPGCLKHETDDLGPVPAYEPGPLEWVDSDPIQDEAPPHTPLAPLPADDSDGYTGCVIYTGPKCRPCQLLHNDIKRICDLRPTWTLGVRGEPEYNASEHWIIVPPGKHGGPYPTLVYYENGEIVETVEGYTNAITFDSRRKLLSRLFAKHPHSSHYR